jgi:GDP-4-dehydro-6-deoxy-D-mannose reductase
MTILITGSDGFLGKNLTFELSKLDYQVLGLNREDGDLAVLPIDQLISEDKLVDKVFHLAAKTFVPDAWENPEEFIKENISSTLNVLNFCRLRKLPLIYISAYIYGEQNSLPIREDSEVKPSNPYAQSKYLCEEICRYYVEVFSLDITIIRPFNVYGSGQSKNFLIPQIINQIKNNEELVVNSFNPKRDYIHVEDLMEAIVIASSKIQGLQIYNIGSGSSISVKGIIETIEEILGRQLGFNENQIERNNELMDVVADISRAYDILNWKPKLDIREGLTKILIEEGMCSLV